VFWTEKVSTNSLPSAPYTTIGFDSRGVFCYGEGAGATSNASNNNLKGGLITVGRSVIPILLNILG